MNINVDKIYVCHWNKLTDRKLFLLDQFKKFNIDNEIEFIEDFEIDNLSDCKYNYIYKNIFEFNSKINRFIKKSEISLFYKHIKILEDFRDKKYKSILVLEDDALFTSDFENINSYITELPNDFDICWVGSCCDLKSNKIEDGNHVYKENGSRCTHGFILNSNIFEKVDVFGDVPICVADAYYNHLIDDRRYLSGDEGFRLNNYWMEPSLILQNNMFITTIQK